ncbi:hypothetical protein J6V86_03485 [bacterium]|nr:hypothetical protein [bacterium]
MKNIIIAKWWDVYEILQDEVLFCGMFEHDDIVQISLHIEIEIQQIGRRRCHDDLNEVRDIMIYIIAQLKLKLIVDNEIEPQ